MKTGLVLANLPEDVSMTGEFLAADAIVEIPRGSRNKYEFDQNTGSIRLDRVLFSAVHFPGDRKSVV